MRNYAIFYIYAKVFVNGAAKNVPDELGQFIRFLADGSVEPGITKEISDAVEQVKAHKGWERDYMTLMIRDRQNIEQGRAEGLAEGEAKHLVATVERYMDKHNCSALDACDVIGYDHDDYFNAKALLERDWM